MSASDRRVEEHFRTGLNAIQNERSGNLIHTGDRVRVIEPHMNQEKRRDYIAVVTRVEASRVTVQSAEHGRARVPRSYCTVVTGTG